MTCARRVHDVCVACAWHMHGVQTSVAGTYIAYDLHCTQDFARNDFELRQFIVGGKVEHRVYSNFAWVDADGYMREFVMKERAEAVSDWLEGDEAAMVVAERKAAKLVGAWLTWLRCQSVEALPAVRMDMLIKRTAPGAAEVFTLETPTLSLTTTLTLTPTPTLTLTLTLTPARTLTPTLTLTLTPTLTPTVTLTLTLTPTQTHATSTTARS